MSDEIGAEPRDGVVAEISALDEVMAVKSTKYSPYHLGAYCW
jgi:hypothetical protein